jgi:hypothetical protein
VAVAFDGWQPETEVDERQVEMWIAENVISSNKVVYLISSNPLASGWIRRECEWERRMLGLRETFELPLLVPWTPRLSPKREALAVREDPPALGRAALASPQLQGNLDLRHERDVRRALWRLSRADDAAHERPPDVDRRAGDVLPLEPERSRSASDP